ncbi:hypothetical protein MTR67_038712 [Solanum verrucosum]|uniref:Uncharacterized protein n=1 Tax=Solanum verrucosum TaxID=315347 RepID=A0AAF0UG23_SOLVR|nr:hypothetical protein MTR67_038712 [Solanum verrucosum]
MSSRFKFTKFEISLGMLPPILFPKKTMAFKRTSRRFNHVNGNILEEFIFPPPPQVCPL